MTDRADDLRRAFDRAFAEPPPAAPAASEDLLMIRLAGDPYALRLRDVAGLLASRKVVAVPADAPGLLGLAGVRGDLVPVFDLTALIGRGALADPPRWLVLCGDGERVGLAFPVLEGHLRVARTDLHHGAAPTAASRHIDGLVRTDAGVRPVVAIPSILATIRHHRARPGAPED